MSTRSGRMAAVLGMVFVLCAISAHAVDERKWRATAQVDVPDATHPPVDNFTPEVAVDHSGNVMVVWELSDGTIWSRRFRASDKQWEAPLKVTDVGSSPQVAMDGSGNAFAVWEQSGGVRARRYSNGSWGTITPLQAISGAGSTPQIVADANGNALAVWSQSGGHVWANRYTKNSASWGTAEQLESNAGTALSPQIGIDANGNALAVWTQAQTIWANYFTTLGTPHWVGAKVAETNTANASAPQVAMDGVGNGRAIWTETDAGADHVWSSRYTASSNQWDQVRAIESNAGSAVAPQVAADATGNAVAVWFQFNSSCNCNNVFSSRYVTSTSQWEGALLLESDNTHDAVSPSISMDANGSAVAVWQQRQLDASVFGIFAARYSPSATLQASWAPAVLIEHDDHGNASLPRVVFDANRVASAVWFQSDSQSDTQHFHIISNRYEFNQWKPAAQVFVGNGLNGEPQVVVDPTGTSILVWIRGGIVYSKRHVPGRDWEPEIALSPADRGAGNVHIVMDAKGNALAVWRSTPTRPGDLDRVGSIRYLTNGGWQFPARTDFNNTDNVVNPQVAMDPAGNAIVVWQQSRPSTSVWSQRAFTGVWVAPEMIASTSTGVSDPQIAMDSGGNAMVVWEQDDGTGTTHKNVAWSRRTPTTPWTPPQTTIGLNANDTDWPQLAFAPNGDATVVWFEHALRPPFTDQLWGNRYFASTNTWEGPALADIANASDVGPPSLVVDARGTALSTWTGGQVDSSFCQVTMTRHPSGPTWDVPPLVVGRVDTIPALRPALAVDGGGNALLIWRQKPTDTDTTWQLYASRSFADQAWNAQAWSAPLALGPSFTNARAPSIAVNAKGDAEVVYLHTNPSGFNEIWAARFE